VPLSTGASSSRAWQDARRILCVRLDAMGDVLMMSPAIRALAGADGRRALTLFTSPSGAEAGRLIPELDDLIVYEAPWMKATRSPRSSAGDRAMIRQLKARRFDAAVIFTTYTQSPLPAALLCYLADIPLRLAHCRENPYHLLSDWVRDPEPDTCIRHEVRRQLDLVASIGASTEDDRIQVRISAEAATRVDLLLSQHVDSGTQWILIHPGATAASRRYPPDLFAAVARELTRSTGCHILFSGSEQERELIESIQDMMQAPSSSLAGRLTLEEMAALLSKAPLLISNNTGTVHLAAAAETPVVDLYALTNPQHTPWRVPQRVLFHDVPCRFCYQSNCPEGHHRCLQAISPESVVGASLALLEETRSHGVSPVAAQAAGSPIILEDH
jgi:lipopolysaccharide heptosyltransferase II